LYVIFADGYEIEYHHLVDVNTSPELVTTGATTPVFVATVVGLADHVLLLNVCHQVCFSIDILSPPSVNSTRTTHCHTTHPAHFPSNTIFQLDNVSFVIVVLVTLFIVVHSFCACEERVLI
jgi:hypothetical protein